jgi:hypothetical protein
MFGFFKKNNGNEGVLTNLKTVSRWLEDLPTGDIYSAQEKVVQNLIEFNHASRGYDKDRLQVLMHLDEATREIQGSLCLQYLRNARMSKAVESRLWITIHAFFWEVTRSYHGFLMDFIANPGGSKTQAYIPLVTARAIRGFADIIKWRYFRYEKLDEKLWLRLHNLYRVAEFDNFANIPLTVYRTDGRQFSPAQEYGQAILLSPFGGGSLAAREIEMVDHWLDNWSGHIQVDSQYDPERDAFYVDTGKGEGAHRCNGQGNEGNLRFIATLSLLNRIQEVRESLKKGTSAAKLGLSEDFRLPEGYTLLKQVETAWALPSAGDRRGDERAPQAGQWKVIHGLAAICDELAKTGPGNRQSRLSPEEMLDIQLYGFVTERTKEQALERARESGRKNRKDIWEQIDISDKGLGFRVGHHDCEWLKIGKLVAISPSEGEQWQIGVVCRLARLDDDYRLVGVRTLEGRLTPVTLRAEETETEVGYVVGDMEDPSSEDPHSLALLQALPDQDNRLIIDSARYAHERIYAMRAPHTDSQVIRLLAVDDTGDSWLQVNFNVVAV